MTGFLAYYCDGVDINRGITTAIDDELFLEKAFRSNCETLIILADHSKFNRHFYYKSMELIDADIIITDEDPGKEWEDFCNEHGIELLY